MQIVVKNYRGIEEAELVLAPVALVCGPNGGGKTSIAQAVAAALTDNAVVVGGVNKGDAGLLLRDGAKRGRCTVSDKHGSATVNWPGASTSAEGDPPRASAIAAGLATLAEMKPKDAALALIAALQAEPTREDLNKALAEHDIDETVLDAIWGVIESSGWDAAHKRAVDNGTKRKGAWEHVTGTRYGAAKAATWRAQETPDDVEGLDELLAEQRGVLEAAMANQAVSEAEVEALNRAVDDGQAADNQVADLEAELAAARAAEQAIADKRQALPAPQDEERSTPCPHCKKSVVIAGGELRAPSKGLSAEENAARRGAIQETAAELRTANLKSSDASSRLTLAKASAATGRRAAARLAEVPEGGSTAEQLEAARTAVDNTSRMIAAARRTSEAAALHDKIETGLLLIEALAPTGLRQRALDDRLAELNARLAALSETAGWAGVAISAELAVTFGGRPYSLLAASEQFRCRVTLQVALAEHDGSAMLVIDAADILDRKGRNGLFAVLKESGLEAMVCMTMNHPDDVPDLARAGIGRSYWLGGGVAAATGNA